MTFPIRARWQQSKLQNIPYTVGKGPSTVDPQVSQNPFMVIDWYRQNSLYHCPILINTDQNSGIDPKYFSMLIIADQCQSAMMKDFIGWIRGNWSSSESNMPVKGNGLQDKLQPIHISTITCNFSASCRIKRLFYQSPSVVISMNYCSSRFTQVFLIQEYSVIIHNDVILIYFLAFRSFVS